MTSKKGEYSGSDSDNVDEDMEALRRAYILTGTKPGDPGLSTATPSIALPGENDDEDESDSEEEDLELFRSLQRQFSNSKNVKDEESLPSKLLRSIRPGTLDNDSDYEDDFQLLRAIQQQFSQYNGSANDSTVCSSQKHEQVDATNKDSEKESSNNLFIERTKNGEGFPDCVDTTANTQNSDPTGNIGLEKPLSGSFEWHESGGETVSVSPDRNSSLQKSAQLFDDAIKKNRSYQKFIREKIREIETRIEENDKLRKHAKILKDFQVACRKRTGQALSRRKDAHVQLISVPKLRANAKVDERKVSAFYNGPAENSQVGNYRMALKKFPRTFSRAKWSEEENENLAKGIKQQFQEMLLKKYSDSYSKAGGDTKEIDSTIASIRDHDINSKDYRLILPKVDWKQLASLYVTGRSDAECESRWSNCENPLINHKPWTKLEDKKILQVVENKGISNWIDIAEAFGTNRTPFQCLARYQRSLNASILKREWSEDEDVKLRAAVAACGESNWLVVASTMEGRTGPQCSNRWRNSLNPSRERVGRWSSHEDKRLKIAVMLFGGKNWYRKAQFVPGRTQVQCRERWVNCLDPSLNMGKWTDEEDSRLRAAISEHKYSWSKVAACVAPRTDSQCRRRWAVLHPHEVSLLKAARKTQKKAMISNFVGRELERPALGPDDFIPIESIPVTKDLNCPQRQKRKLRREKSKTKDRACSKKKMTSEDENDIILQKTRKHRKRALLSSEVSTLQPKVGASADVVECSQNSQLPLKCPTADISEDQSSTAFGACKQQRMPRHA